MKSRRIQIFLGMAQGSVKTAIAMHRLDATPEEAEARLAEVGGQVSALLSPRAEPSSGAEGPS